MQMYKSYRWSSAAAHCGLREDIVLSNKARWKTLPDSIDDWSDWLSVEEEISRLDVLRTHVEKGMPCGADEFVHALGEQIGRALKCRPQGRPKLKDSD